MQLITEIENLHLEKIANGQVYQINYYTVYFSIYFEGETEWSWNS